MNINDLGKALEEDDINLKLERLKMGLISRATGGGMDPIEYKNLRKSVLGLPNMDNLLPRFLKLCRTIDEFWDWIKAQAPSYAERRLIISDALNPLLEKFEFEISEGALEFSKNYEEKGIIGQGGFGLVYLYEHRQLKLPLL